MLTSKDSIWIGQAQAIFNSRELRAQAGENPELRVLYFRLARLLKLPVTAVFVFDGPKRPAVKRGKQVRPKPHWLTHGLEALVTAFGFHSHQVIYCFSLSLAVANLCLYRLLERPRPNWHG
jgi:Holliday junction resolvase YEN1